MQLISSALGCLRLLRSDTGAHLKPLCVGLGFQSSTLVRVGLLLDGFNVGLSLRSTRLGLLESRLQDIHRVLDVLKRRLGARTICLHARSDRVLCALRTRSREFSGFCMALRRKGRFLLPV